MEKEHQSNHENHVEGPGAAGTTAEPNTVAKSPLEAVVAGEVATAGGVIGEANAKANDNTGTLPNADTGATLKANNEGVGDAVGVNTHTNAQQKTVQHSVRKDSASWVYEHWIPATSSAEGSKQKFSCKYCKNAQYRHNVTRMRNHLINCCMAPAEAKETAQLRCTVIAERKDNKKVEKNKKLEREQEVTSGMKKRKTIDGLKKQGMDASVDNNKLDVLFAKAYSSLKLSQDCLSNPKLINFIAALNPQYRLPTISTVRNHQIQLKLTTETFDDVNATNATTTANANANAAGGVAEYREAEQS